MSFLPFLPFLFGTNSTKLSYQGRGFGTATTHSLHVLLVVGLLRGRRGLGLLDVEALVGLVPEGALRQRHAELLRADLDGVGDLRAGMRDDSTTPSSRLDDGAGTRDDGALDRRRRPRGDAGRRTWWKPTRRAASSGDTPWASGTSGCTCGSVNKSRTHFSQPHAAHNHRGVWPPSSLRLKFVTRRPSCQWSPASHSSTAWWPRRQAMCVGMDRSSRFIASKPSTPLR